MATLDKGRSMAEIMRTRGYGYLILVEDARKYRRRIKVGDTITLDYGGDREERGQWTSVELPVGRLSLDPSVLTWTRI